MLRILITDDHPLFRKGLRTLLEADPDFEVVGEATTAAESVAFCGDLQPDMVLMDLQMPGGSGIDAIREINRQFPGIYILVLTLFEDDSFVFAALRAGARGYLLKDSDEVEIIRAIQAVANGEAIFSSGIANQMIRFFTSPSTRIPPDVFPDLSDRERETLGLLAQGKSPSQIASLLYLSPKTVSNYISNIINKLQVADRTEAILRAREAGYGK
jgi:DNA-binding NarL/FixJ family response regulator